MTQSSPLTSLFGLRGQLLVRRPTTCVGLGSSWASGPPAGEVLTQLILLVESYKMASGWCVSDKLLKEKGMGTGGKLCGMGWLLCVDLDVSTRSLMNLPFIL